MGGSSRFLRRLNGRRQRIQERRKTQRKCAAGLRMALGLADGSPPGMPIPKVAAARVSNEPLMLRGKGVRRRSRRDNPVGGSG